MNKNLKFFLEKIFSIHFSNAATNINIKASSFSIVDARKLLPEYEIPRSETIMPDGTIVKSLFMDYIPDRDYILSKLFRRSKQQFEKELKEYECYSATKDRDAAVEKLIQDCFPEQEKETAVTKPRPCLPFFSYN
ncbi:MAG: hypothetical protein WCJ57_01495 [Candidatus Falkowbacteria bacterium]